jgi:aminomethyltransferase
LKIRALPDKPVRIGLKLSSRRIAREHSQVYQGETQIGEVSSGTFSPTLEQSIAMAYLKTEAAAVGTTVDIDIRGKREAAEVVALPFYHRPS